MVFVLMHYCRTYLSKSILKSALSVLSPRKLESLLQPASVPRRHRSLEKRLPWTRSDTSPSRASTPAPTPARGSEHSETPLAVHSTSTF